MSKSSLIFNPITAFMLLLQALPGSQSVPAVKHRRSSVDSISQHLWNSSVFFDTTTTFDANNLRMYMRNSGQLIDYSMNPLSGGLEWPKNSSHYVVYTGGLWVAGKVNDSLRIAAVQYDIPGFQPGTMVAGVPAKPESSAFRFYKISRADTTGYSAWINAGALTLDGQPLRKGKQNIWCVYNDGRASSVREFHTKPLNIEVQQYVYGDSLAGPISNTVFAEFRIFNRDTLASIDSAYVSLWLDPDIGDHSDDAAGVDTALSLGYGYNGRDTDAVYGSLPPAVGLFVLRSPANGGSPSPPFAFVAYDPFLEFPNNAVEAYNYLHGLDRSAIPIQDPVRGQPTRFMFSGDPVTGSGWVDTSRTDRAILLSFGPFALAAGASTVFHTAIIVAQGSDNLNSIVALRDAVPAVKAYYDAHVLGVREIADLPSRYELMQNYPNPFNPTTDFGFRIADFGLVRLKVYDVLGREVVTLVNSEMPAGSYQARWDARDVPSGVYFYRLSVYETSGQTQRFTATRKMAVLR